MPLVIAASAGGSDARATNTDQRSRRLIILIDGQSVSA
jgi:hypothetical protein